MCRFNLGRGKAETSEIQAHLIRVQLIPIPEHRDLRFKNHKTSFHQKIKPGADFVSYDHLICGCGCACPECHIFMEPTTVYNNTWILEKL